MPAPVAMVGVTFHVRGVFEFDGRRFPGDWFTLPLLWMAAKARRGDQAARELLDASGCITVNDADGKPYWPPGESE